MFRVPIRWLLIAVVSGSCYQPEVEGPSILLISIDTLRADHLAAYGYHRDTAPTLTRMAKGSFLFRNSYSQAPSTVPTHASMFTGKFPFEHQMFNFRDSLSRDEWTLAEHFSSKGYRTFAITSSIRFVREARFDQGFDQYHPVHELEKNDRSSVVTNIALEQVQRARGRPFFGFLHFFDPHEPYAPPEPYRSRFHRSLEEPSPEETSVFLQRNNSPTAVVQPEVLKYLEALYDGSILFLDAQVSRLLRGLEDLAVDRETVVVITSDHGEEFKEHGGLSHSDRLWEELLRVPLLISIPGMNGEGGSTIDVPVQTVDLYPTICDLAGVPAPEGLSGRSFAHIMIPSIGAQLRSAQTRSMRGPAIPRLLFIEQNPRLWGVIEWKNQTRHKLTINNRTMAFYDLLADPVEANDLHRSKEEIATELYRRALLARRESANARVRSDERAVINDDELERLRSLGYLHETTPVGD